MLSCSIFQFEATKRVNEVNNSCQFHLTSDSVRKNAFVLTTSSSKFLSNATCPYCVTSLLDQMKTMGNSPNFNENLPNTSLVHQPDCFDGEGEDGHFFQEGELYL